MNASLSEDTVVFLSHNSEDKPLVESIARSLEQQHGLATWMDKWNLIPGDPFVPAIENAISSCDAVVVFIGASGVGSWQGTELQLAIDRQVSGKKARFPVIPVRLPDGPEFGPESNIPSILKLNTWVEFASADDGQALQRLVAGILGKEPGPTAWTSGGSASTSDDKESEAEANQSSHKQYGDNDKGRHSSWDDIGQEGLNTDAPSEFLTRLRKQLEDALSPENLSDFVAYINQNTGSGSVNAAARYMLALDPPTDSLKEVLKACNLLPDAYIDTCWLQLRNVYLLLLLRLIDPDWIQRQCGGDRQGDLRLFELTIPGNAPSRGVEVVMARLDSDRSGILFDSKAQPVTQIHTDEISFRNLGTPEAQTAVENLGFYLLSKYGADVPERMQRHHWEEIDAHLRWRRQRELAFYLVIPDEDLRYGTDDALALLRKNLPNLPRFLMTTNKDANPLLCNPYDIDGSIKAFWDLDPRRINTDG